MDIPIELIKDVKEFQNKRIPELEDEFKLKKVVLMPNENINDVQFARGIEFSCKCEHHLVGIKGKVWFAYLPDEYLIGISQVARVIEYLANVTVETIQERLAKQIADYLEKILKPKALWIIIEAEHFCATQRGVRQRNMKWGSSAIRGQFKDDNALRNEVVNIWNLMEVSR
jgi:GTP cyclohydrolase I